MSIMMRLEKMGEFILENGMAKRPSTSDPEDADCLVVGRSFEEMGDV